MLLLQHAAITLLEIVLGLAARRLFGAASALLLALGAGAALAAAAAGRRARRFPVFALAPLLVLWLGYGIAVQDRDGGADHLLPGHRRLLRRPAPHRAGLARSRPRPWAPARWRVLLPNPRARGPARAGLGPARRRRGGADRRRDRRVGRLQRRASAT